MDRTKKFMLRNRSRQSGAFTLVELLLVMAIIVSLLGFGVPLVMRMYARNQIRTTAQEMQTTLNRTRLEAMKSGKAIVFRYRYDSPVYEILPKDVFEQRKKSENGGEAFAIGTDQLEDRPSPEAEQAAGVFQYMLPHEIVFGDRRAEETPPLVSTELLNDTVDSGGRAMTFDESFDDGFHENDGMDSDAVFDDGWSPPILFFPNGRTSQATLELRTTNRYNYRETLVLRGLTGTAGIVEQ